VTFGYGQGPAPQAHVTIDLRHHFKDPHVNDALRYLDAEQPVTMARATGAELLRQMREMADKMTAIAGRLTTSVATIGDPTAAEAEVEFARAAAEQRTAAADASRAAADEAAEEMSEHLAAEQARAADARDRLTEAIAAHPECDHCGRRRRRRIPADDTSPVRELLLPHPPRLRPRHRDHPHRMTLPRLTGTFTLVWAGDTLLVSGPVSPAGCPVSCQNWLSS
jgi:nucleoid-associated protein YgaU